MSPGLRARARIEASLHLAAGRLFIKRDLAYLAQAIAFQALLSFVPFLLLVVSFWGHWLGGDEAASEKITHGLRLVLPVAAPVINRSFDSLVQNPGFYTAVSLGALLWLAGSVFRTIDYAINVAFDTHEERGALLAQVKGLVLVFFFGSLLGLWVLSQSVLSILSQQLPADLHPLIRLWESYLMADVVPMVVLAGLFTALYHRLPHRPVAWRDALRGGILIGIGLHVALQLFNWALSRTMSYNLLSGTVAALVAFLIWIYWGSCIFLYGASVVAALTERASGAAPPP